MAKKTAKRTKSKSSSETSIIIQAGIVFVVIAAIIIFAYAYKNFT